MGLFSFFKKSDKVGKNSTVDSKDVLGGKKGQISTQKQEVHTKLSFHPDWNVPQEQKYVFNFLANDLEPLKPNQLSLAAINIEEDDATGAWNVKAFFRSSLNQSIELKEIDLFITDAEGNVVAKQSFDFAQLGTIPAESARPWVFTFKKESLLTDEIPGEGWKIAFNLVSLRGHQLDLDAQWEKQLKETQKEELRRIVKELPKLRDKEVNFTGIQHVKMDNGSLAITLLIRNGNDRDINLEQLPLEVVDATGTAVANGTFKLDPVLVVKANTSKPWTFVYPADLTTNLQEADFTRWAARVPQQAK